MKKILLIIFSLLLVIITITGCNQGKISSQNELSMGENDVVLQYLVNMPRFKEMNGHDISFIGVHSVDDCEDCLVFTYQFVTVSEKDPSLFDNVTAVITYSGNDVIDVVFSRGILEEDPIDSNLIDPDVEFNDIDDIENLDDVVFTDNLSIECESLNGTWISKFDECEFISADDCSRLNGSFNECGSACRHVESDEPIACIAMCVPYCAFDLIDNTQEENNSVKIANPASVHCIEQGGSLELISNETGSYGMCTLLNGTVCEEWALFRGECLLE